MAADDKQVMLVDEEDRDLGLYPKLLAHQEGVLHRAFSVFVFNSKRQLLLQKRADTKYHSPKLWSNTCCSHPLLKQNIEKEAQKRLEEEMGFTCPVSFCFKFIYKVQIDELIEYEMDHVYVGFYDGLVLPHEEEVSDYKYISLDELDKDLKQHPELYTAWFKICYSQLKDYYNVLIQYKGSAVKTLI